MEIAALLGGVFAGDPIRSSYIKKIASTATYRTILPCRKVWSEQKQEVFSSRACRPWQHMQWNHFVGAAHWHRVIISVQESLRSMTFSQVMNRTMAMGFKAESPCHWRALGRRKTDHH
jgi:hypothetical protein